MSPKVTEEHKEQRRRSILDAAKEIFAKKGYEAFVMQDVINAVDLSRGGVYSYFSSKEDLFESLLESMHESFHNGIQELADNPSIWESITNEFESFKKMKDTKDPFTAVQIEFFLIHRRIPEKSGYFKKRYQYAIDQFVWLFQQGVERGEFEPKYALETIARYYITFNDGIHISTVFVNKRDIDYDQQIDIFLTQLANMLGVRKKK
ncbi:TetR/AcrR family transcriptional regulator [Fictibacillus phosphorivorans]|uniref:TetR/AcrR family transcriptional regulator n=1 Tax=Fictibacillus phosphorivorans TaxID=1221500 RepID=UPI0012930B78|nr:TetR family transcriptional regulator [Fictibacillus phosphorivorans]MQR95191.1 TetR/AcrR family transcriptional regulator [Fictibacillus phosphorivorans]